MTGRDDEAGRRRPLWSAAASGLAMTAGLLVGTVAAAVLIVVAVTLAVGRPGTTPLGTTTEPIAQPPDAVAERATEQAADPVRIRIPSIGVDASVDPLLVDENGVLPPPDTYEGTGWWQEGPEPGEVGPAVIAGHVDSFEGPAVFYRLDQLDDGDEIFVDRADGTTVAFEAQRTERHDKNDFPTGAVYGDTPDAQLRLITCGGEFDQDGRRYLDNVIVYATLIG